MTERVGVSLDIVTALCKRYAVFCTDLNYYEDVLLSFANLPDDKKIREANRKILEDLRSHIKDDNKWFIDYLEKQIKSSKNLLKTLSSITNLCGKWEIELDIDTLSLLITQSSILDKALNECVKIVTPITISHLEKISDNRALNDLLIAYAMIKNLLQDEKEEDLDNDAEKGNNALSYYSDDIVKMYLMDIKQYALLNAEEEKEIALLASQGSEKAAKELANHNLRLVVSIAKKFTGRGLDFIDLIQAGNEGLLKAVQRFDPNKGCRFSTYATWWIRQSIDRTIKDEGRTIRLPVHLYDDYLKIVKTRESLIKLYGEDVPWEEVAAHLQMNVDAVINIFLEFRDNVSINSPVGDEEDSELGDFIVNPDDKTPEDVIIKEDLKGLLTEALSTLKKREEEVIRMRFGLQDSDNPRPEYSSEHTLEEVGAVFGVTRERIRQIEAKALRKMRHPVRSKHLDAYYDKNTNSSPMSVNESKGKKSTIKPIRYTRFSSGQVPKKNLNGPVRVIKPGDPDWIPPKPKREIKGPEPYKYNGNLSLGSKPQMEEGSDNMGEKRNHREASYLYESLGVSMETLALVIPYVMAQKDTISYKALIKVHGEKLDQKGSTVILDEQERIGYYNGYGRLEERLNRLNSKPFLSLKEVLGVPDELYDELLAFLKKQPGFEVLTIVHGPDLGVYANDEILDRKKNAIYNHLIEEGKKHLSFISSHRYLQEIIDCPNELWNNLKEVIDADEQISSLLGNIFGKNYTERENIKGLERSRKNKYKNVINYLTNLVKKAQKNMGKDLITILDVEVDDKEVALNKIRNSEFAEQLKPLFSDDLTGEINISAYLLMGSENFEKLLQKCFVELKRREPTVSLLQVLGLKDEDVDILIAFRDTLSGERKQRLQNIFGEDLLQKGKGLGAVKGFVYALKQRALTAVDMKNKTIYESFEITSSLDMIRFREKLRKANCYKVAAAIYGENLQDTADIPAFFKQDGRSYSSFVASSEVILERIRNNSMPLEANIQSYEGKKLEDIVGCSVDDLVPLIMQTNEKHIAEDLCIIHGTNNDYPFSYTNPSIDLELCKRYNRYIEKLRNLYKAAQDNLEVPETPTGLSKAPEIPEASSKVTEVSAELPKIPEIPETSSKVTEVSAELPKVPEIPETSSKVIEVSAELPKVPEIPETSLEVPEDPVRLLNAPETPEIPSEVELLVPGNAPVTLTNYTHPLFKEAIKIVPINYRYILMLHLGLQDDGICYPVETLMEIFNRSKEDIESALVRGKVFFDEIVASYEKVYERSFPFANNEMGETRKRIPKTTE